jgi:hypothetical protein
LGTALLCRLAQADELGIQVLDAEVLAENHKMLRVFRDCGYPVKIHSLPWVQLVELRTSWAPNTPQASRAAHPGGMTEPSVGRHAPKTPARAHERPAAARGRRTRVTRCPETAEGVLVG